MWIYGSLSIWVPGPVTPNSGKRCFTVSIKSNIVVMPSKQGITASQSPQYHLPSSASRRYFARRSACPLEPPYKRAHVLPAERL